jgi:hypothetical protein
MSAEALGSGSPFCNRSQSTSSSGDRGIRINPVRDLIQESPRGAPPLVSDITAPLHFADDPMQQPGSNHFVLAKLRRNVLKQGVAVGLRYGFGGLHQAVKFVVGKAQSQLIERCHGNLHIERTRMPQPHFSSDCSSPPFVGCAALTQREAAKAPNILEALARGRFWSLR